MASPWDLDAEQEDDEEQDEDNDFKDVNDRIVFLLDARPAMAVGAPAPLLHCFQVLIAIYKAKIVSQDKSMMSVAFFGSAQQSDADGVAHVYVLFPLEPPAAKHIRKLQDFHSDLRTWQQEIGSMDASNSRVPLKQALWTCSQAFSVKGYKKTDFKRIWIFTNDDQPNQGLPNEQKAVLTVGKDCMEAGIELSLWYLQSSAALRPFDTARFYEQLLSQSNAADGEVSLEDRMIGATANGFDMFAASVRRKTFRKRRLRSCYFSFGESKPLAIDKNTNEPVYMAVLLYKLISITKKPLHTWLHAATNEPIKSVSKFYDATTGETIAPEDITTYIDVQQHRVPFTADEMRNLKTMSMIGSGNAFAGIELLFFLPRDQLPDEWTIDAPYFLYPFEQAVKGSSALFEALLRETHRQNVVMIVRFQRLPTSMSRLAALLPQLEEIDEDGCQVVPPGFHCLPLPFAEEIRFNPLTVGDNAEEEAIEAVQPIKETLDKVIDKMLLPDDFVYWREIDNPALQQFYSVLQAIALGEEELEWQHERDDKLRLSEEMKEKCQEDFDRLKDMLAMEGTTVSQLIKGKTSRKRSTKDDEETVKKPARKKRVDEDDEDDDEEEEVVKKPARKKRKDEEVEEDGEAMDKASIGLLVTSNKIAKCKVAELKDMCRALKLPVSGNKAELIERISSTF